MGMVEGAYESDPTWLVLAEGVGVVSLGLQVRLRDGVIGEGREGVDHFSVAASILGAFVKEADVDGRGAEDGMPGGDGESHLGGGGGNEVYVPEEPALV